MIMKYNNPQSGFTLLEMTVSVALFTIMVLISFSTLISLSQEARKAQAIRTAVGNLGATIEGMTRSIRMGKDIQCSPSLPSSGLTSTIPTNCPGGESSLAFEPITGAVGAQPIVFRLSDGRIERSLFGGQTSPTNSFKPYTAEGITITNLKFFVSGSEIGKQPMVTISMEGYADKDKTSESSFIVQTTVAVRTPNL